jgi:hypothetical protein
MFRESHMDCNGAGKVGRDASLSAEQQTPLGLGDIAAVYVSA